MQVLHVVGARPNFMKVAPVMAALSGVTGIEQILVHTGQHYDVNMSDIFFRQLGIREPDVNLQVGSASHTVQTAQIMTRFEEVVTQRQPDLVLVYGDVNSTMAATLVCAKMMIRVGHVEAGLRSNDRTMPEEINRLVTDQLADLLFTPSEDGDQNLLREGVAKEKIHFVGNVMIDTLARLLPEAKKIQPDGLPERFALVTLHRPSNVDDPGTLLRLVETLERISYKLPVLFPIHPRTHRRLLDIGWERPLHADLQLLDPVGYIDFLALQLRASVVITDSGGVQEETTYLGIPCLTVRNNTERPVTVTLGTNTLVYQDMRRLMTEIENILAGSRKQGRIPPLWDGKASERIAQVIARLC